MCILNKLQQTYPGGYWLNFLVEVTSVRNLRFFPLLNMNYLNPQHILKIQTVFSEIDRFISSLRIIIGVTSSVVAKLFKLHKYKEMLMYFSEEERLSFFFHIFPFLPPFLSTFFLSVLIWNTVDLQYCVSFRYAIKWISYTYTCISLF